MNEDNKQVVLHGRGGDKWSELTTPVSLEIANLSKENCELKSMIKALLTFVPDRHEELIMKAKKLIDLDVAK